MSVKKQKESFEEEKSKEEDSKKDEEESSLEEIIVESKPEISREEKKEESKKFVRDSGGGFEESFLEDLSESTNVSLDKRNSFLGESLESNLGGVQKEEKKEELLSQSSSFEYIPKGNLESSKASYINYNKSPEMKFERPEDISKSWSKPFQEKQVEFVSSEAGKLDKTQASYEPYIKPKRIDELDKEKNEKNFALGETKMEYYSQEK